MHPPVSTGQVAQFLGVVEPRLNGIIRRGRVVPVPPVIAGRRQWSADHIRAAAAALRVSLPAAASLPIRRNPESSGARR
jgi:hypothetical protein